jgi:hypothetical protein
VELAMGNSAQVIHTRYPNLLTSDQKSVLPRIAAGQEDKNTVSCCFAGQSFPSTLSSS